MSEALVARTKNPAKKSLSQIQIRAAQAYGQGHSRREIAKAYLEHLSPNSVGKPTAYRLRLARSRLRKWEMDQTFRDKVYSMATVNLDMVIPQVLTGVAQRAIRGRVDAARLALEVTGRHNPKGEHAPPTVVVAIDGISRPGVTQIADAEVIEASEDD